MNMEIISTTAALRASLAAWRGAARVGLTPTMGNLHEGHIELVRAARKACDFVVTSIFVNPMQFGPNEDFSSYPRTLDADCEVLEAAGVDIVFTPGVDEVYPNEADGQTVVSVPALSRILCGESRPGHFDGVTTVVTKFFNMVQPDAAYFGEKDWQQLTVIRVMARQLNMPIEIVGVPTVRDSDGLALSSRNQYLSDAERAIAPTLYQTLLDMRHAIEDGAHDYAALEHTGRMALSRAGFRPDYVAIRDAATLRAPSDGSLRILAAAWLGKARLIDNIGAEVP